MKKRRFGIDMLGWDVEVVAGGTTKQADRLGAKFLGADLEQSRSCTGYVAHLNRRMFMWFAEDWDDATIVHECYHAVERIMAHHGADGEMGSLLMEYIFTKVRECLE